jgi:hypothetical protein
VKKTYIIGIVTLLLIGLLAGVSSAMAQDEAKEYTVISAPLSPVEEDYVYSIPVGSSIFHSDNGITLVYGPDGACILSAKESEASMITTPIGLRRATHIHEVPSGSHIKTNGDITEVYKDGIRILTVVDQTKGNTITPDFSGWIEYSKDWSVDELEYFRAKWEVTSAPPDPVEDAIDFLFNGIEPQNLSAIIQPVLEWNQLHSHRWTGRAWHGSWGDYYCSGPINVNEGDTIYGILSYLDSIEYWYVSFYDDTTGQDTYLESNYVGTTDLVVVCTLEAKFIESNDDVPGDTTFYDMTFLDSDGNDVDIDWEPEYDPDNPDWLTGLNVVIYSDSRVKLETAN